MTKETKMAQHIRKGDVFESPQGDFHMTATEDARLVDGEVHFGVRFQGMGRGGPMLAVRQVDEELTIVEKATRGYKRKPR